MKHGGIAHTVGEPTANLTIVDAPDRLMIIDTTLSTDHSKAGMELFPPMFPTMHGSRAPV